MAVDDHLPKVPPSSVTSTSSSSSSSSVIGRRLLAQVATNNSSTFIQFPVISRQSSLFVPIHGRRTNLLSTRPFSVETDTQSISNKSKLSHTPSLSITSRDYKRNHSQQKFNPILNNPLLNHRKQQPISLPTEISTDFSHTTRLSLSSKLLKTTPKDTQISTIRASTAPNQTENTHNTLIIPNDHKNNDQQEIPYIDDSKYDFITRWLNELRLTYSTKTFSKTKRFKKRFVQS